MSSQSKTNSFRKKKIMRRKRDRLIGQLPYYLIGLLIIGLLGGAAYKASGKIAMALESREKEKSGKAEDQNPDGAGASAAEGDGSGDGSEAASDGTEPETESSIDALLDQAWLLAAGYDYDAAIDLLTSSEFYGAGENGTTDSRINSAISEYTHTRESLQPVEITEITHVFFHSLVMDEAKAFDGDADESGYNQVMTTKDEFLKILDSMYAKGYVLVRLHDIDDAGRQDGQRADPAAARPESLRHVPGRRLLL